MYHLHPGNYPLPNTQPGFIVQQDQVIPYTFEPIHFDQYYSETQRHPVQPQYIMPHTDLSSKSQPAVATMSSAEYQHVGVSEAELAEMWAMLEDDNVPAGQQQNLRVKPRLATTVGSSQIDEDSMEGYSRLPGEWLVAFALILTEAYARACRRTRPRRDSLTKAVEFCRLADCDELGRSAEQ